MELRMPEVKVGGYYTFLLNGKEVFSEPVKNLITDYGWGRLLNLTNVIYTQPVLQVGTGNTPPTFADTALAALLASKTGASSPGTAVSGTDSVGQYVGRAYPFSFSQGAVVGNIAEVGVKLAAGDSALTSRSLIKDANGNPAVITVTAIDVLTVTYEMRYYLNRTLDTTGTLNVAGVPTTWTLRAAAADLAMAGGVEVLGYMFNGVGGSLYGTGFSLGAPGVGPTGTPVGIAATLSGIGVNSTTGEITHTLSWTTGTGNVSGGIFGMYWFYTAPSVPSSSHWGQWKLGFSPAIPKDGNKTLAITLVITYVRA